MTDRFTKTDSQNVLAVAKRQPLLVRHLGHMRQRHDERHLGFVVGAGVSEQAGVPLWKELIQRLSKFYGEHGTPESYASSQLSATLIAQFIFNRFKASQTRKTYPIEPRLVPVAVRDEWYRHIYDAIYRDVPKDFNALAEKHPYLAELASLIFHSPFCLSLNFDDILDGAAQRRHSSTSPFDKPNIIWRPPTVDRPNGCVIYHVNGYLPQRKGASRSDNIVLTEDSFAALLASPNIASTEYVTSRVVANTMLMIGASFDDPSLRHLFYSTARRNPSGFHYVFQHDEQVRTKEPNCDEQRDRYELNKEMYNIVTYFVNREEISSLVRMLALPKGKFKQTLNEVSSAIGVETVYRYYVVGTVSAGKSSLIERLRGFKTYEEWADQPLELMFRDHEKLTPGEREEVEEWVIGQLALKDSALKEADYGIHIMDRAPLDMFAFSRTVKENKEKAKSLKGKIGSNGVQEGEIIYLEANVESLMERQLRRGRGEEWLENKAYKEKSLKLQNEQLKVIYSPHVKPTDTTLLNVEEVGRQIAERMLFDDYTPANLEECRKRFEKGEKLR
ncbi:SIR2 family protein [Afipia clevelandensis]|uniref:NadR/Ttd14 AAA domain-containing protein n=1 Tax=Afipia clevelandensis ATCC 49720 TaxID=883079 RepID=K8P127_9BRAD|nr:SIR2 family protein [Afipia clevelandensis]EKS35141.1 hypothetical protein HMPREF9696_02413 [Afipia clevelandensis ATCC 49720]